MSTDHSDCTELYVHRTGDERVSLRPVNSTESLADALSVSRGEHVWLEDVDDELDVAVSVAAARIPHRGHVHVNRCRRVTALVTFNGETKDRQFAPAVRIERVFDWAVSKRGFDLTPTDAAEHVLQITGTNIQPDLADHVGSFADDDCTVSLSLVPKIRNEG